MKLRSLLLITALLANPVAWAGVKETRITLPDDLGSAVLYSNDKASGRDAGVIVVHEWWGLNDYARSRARQLAELGYTAIAVDMYGHGKVADHPKDATAFMEAAFAEPEKMAARFNAAKDILRQHKRVDDKRLYGVGYCFGGAVVLNQARLGNDLYGVASFHGSLGTQAPAEPGKVTAKVLVATGGADPMVPPEQVGNFVAEMSKAGVDLELLSFPGVKHSFTNPGADAVAKKFYMPLGYDKYADEQSWTALRAFLEESRQP